MRSKVEIRAMTGFLVLCWFLFPVAVTAGEPVAPAVAQPAVQEDPAPAVQRMLGKSADELGEEEMATLGGPLFDIPNGSAMPTPTTIRTWEYRDEDAEPYCQDLPEDQWVQVVYDTFTTGPDTTYVELNYNAQFDTLSGADAFEGVLFRARLRVGDMWGFFPGVGEDYYPFIARRDEGTDGQLIPGSYTGTLMVSPNTEYILWIGLRSTDLDATACFQNVTIRHD